MTDQLISADVVGTENDKLNAALKSDYAHLGEQLSRRGYRFFGRAELHRDDDVFRAAMARVFGEEKATYPVEAVVLLNVERADNPHLGLGTGPHVCLGAGFARLEATALFEGLARRRPRLARKEPEVRWRETFVRGLQDLWVVAA